MCWRRFIARHGTTRRAVAEQTGLCWLCLRGGASEECSASSSCGAAFPHLRGPLQSSNCPCPVSGLGSLEAGASGHVSDKRLSDVECTAQTLGERAGPSQAVPWLLAGEEAGEGLRHTQRSRWRRQCSRMSMHELMAASRQRVDTLHSSGETVCERGSAKACVLRRWQRKGVAIIC